MNYLQYVINGISIGSLYALVGLAAMFVLRVTQVMNFAVGGLVVLAGLFGAVSMRDVPPALVLLVLVVLGGPAAIVLHLISTRWLGNTVNAEAGILVTIATATALQGLAYYKYGTELKYAEPLVPLETFHLGDDITVTSGSFVLLGAVVLAFLACWLTLERTRLGRSLRAVSDDPVASRVSGIRVRWVVYSAHAILGVLCFFIGGLTTQVVGTTPDRVFPILIGALFGLVIGGSERVIGPVAGGLAIGIIESFAYSMSSQVGASIIVLVVVLAVLMIVPRGIFQSRSTRSVG